MREVAEAVTHACSPDDDDDILFIHTYYMFVLKSSNLAYSPRTKQNLLLNLLFFELQTHVKLTLIVSALHLFQFFSTACCVTRVYEVAYLT